MKRATAGRGKVVGVSLKDRGCVLPTGRRADLCLWFNMATGGFVTSEYYAGRLPAYLTRFNAGRPADHDRAQGRPAERGVERAALGGGQKPRE